MPINVRDRFASSDSVRWPLVVSCSAIGCHFVVCASDVEHAEGILREHETNGPCPYGEKGLRVEMPVGKSIIERTWDELDLVVAKATNSETDQAERLVCNGMAQGLAWAIFTMCSPHWEQLSDVLNEAAKRHRIATGQEPFTPTPGYDYPHLIKEIELREKKTARQSAESKHPMDEIISSLGVPKIKSILRGLSGGFSEGDLAELYSIPIAAVKRLRAQPDRFAQTGG